MHMTTLSRPVPTGLFSLLFLCAFSQWTSIHLLPEASASSPPSGMVVRIRLADGSMEKVVIPHGFDETMTISDLLQPFSIQDDAKIHVDKTVVDDTSNPLATLPIKHGTLITVQSSTTTKPTESRFSQLKVDPHSWDPFPDLAKDFEHA